MIAPTPVEGKCWQPVGSPGSAEGTGSWVGVSYVTVYGTWSTFQKPSISTGRASG